MNDLRMDEPYLELAIQTVLKSYKNQWEDVSQQDNQDLLKEMAAEISMKAYQFKRITDSAMRQLEE